MAMRRILNDPLVTMLVYAIQYAIGIKYPEGEKSS